MKLFVILGLLFGGLSSFAVDFSCRVEVNTSSKSSKIEKVQNITENSPLRLELEGYFFEMAASMGNSDSGYIYVQIRNPKGQLSAAFYSYDAKIVHLMSVDPDVSVGDITCTRK